MIDILNSEYEEVYYWIQGDLDYDYLRRFKNIEKIHIVPARKDAYDRLLMEDDLDYVGTRLHGGIYAMRHKKRAIIIAIDERAREINAVNHLNCIEKKEIDIKLRDMIRSSLETNVKMPFETIREWKAQFL